MEWTKCIVYMTAKMHHSGYTIDISNCHTAHLTAESGRSALSAPLTSGDAA